MGCVYILKNPAMPDLIKIGHTKRTARERANELYTTGVPEPFEVAYEFPCEDHERLEREIHKKLADHRNNPEREFFRYVVKVNVGKSTEFAYQDQLTIIVPDQPTVPPIPLKIMMNLTIEDPGDYKSVSAIHEDLKKREMPYLLSYQSYTNLFRNISKRALIFGIGFSMKPWITYQQRIRILLSVFPTVTLRTGFHLYYLMRGTYHKVKR